MIRYPCTAGVQYTAYSTGAVSGTPEMALEAGKGPADCGAERACKALAPVSDVRRRTASYVSGD